MPTAKNTKLIGGIIARYQELLGVEIYAYTILSNHIHLLIKAPRGNSDEFIENIPSNQVAASSFVGDSPYVPEAIVRMPWEEPLLSQYAE